jgi:hypothetical protein
MSVLIKNMKMPENCGCCDLTIWDSNNGDYRCFFTGKYTSASASDRKRNTDCPLVEVPPHGRLIDADAFLKENWYFADKDFIDSRYDTTLRELVADAPTVIPPKEEE